MAIKTNHFFYLDVIVVEFSIFGVTINSISCSTMAKYKYESTFKWTFERGRLVVLGLSFFRFPTSV
jgi:hypothetical protein